MEPYSFTAGTAPLLVSMPHVGTGLPAAVAGRIVDDEGTEVARFDKVLAIASAHENIYCTVGTHPHEAGTDGEKDTGPRRLAALAAISASIRSAGVACRSSRY